MNKYAKFNLSEIGLIISELVTSFEGKEYVFNRIMNINNNEKNIYSVVMNSENVLEASNQIVLDISKVNNKFVSFYDIDNEFIPIIPNKFNYVKEFIDEVIEYKKEFNIFNVSIEELSELKESFLNNRINRVK